MALTSQQNNQLLNVARVEGLDADELLAVEEVLLDRAAQLDGATRLDMALSLVNEPELHAAETFMIEMSANRAQAMRNGAQELNAMSEDEWERLTNDDE